MFRQARVCVLGFCVYDEVLGQENGPSGEIKRWVHVPGVERKEGSGTG